VFLKDNVDIKNEEGCKDKKERGKRRLTDSTSGFQLRIPTPTPPPVASAAGFASLLIAIHWK